MEDRGTICFLFFLSLLLVFLIIWPRGTVENYASMDAYYLNEKTQPACPGKCPGICDDEDHCKRVII